MREVDQETGADLNPRSKSPPKNRTEPNAKSKIRSVDEEDIDAVRNPDRPATNSSASLFRARRDVAFDEDLESGPKRYVLSSSKIWLICFVLGTSVYKL